MYARLVLPALGALALVSGCRGSGEPPTPKPPSAQPAPSAPQAAAPAPRAALIEQLSPEEAKAVADALAGVDSIDGTYGTMLQMVEGEHPSAIPTVDLFLRDTQALQKALSSGLSEQGLTVAEAPQWFQHQVNAIAKYEEAAAALKSYTHSRAAKHLTTADSLRKAAASKRNALAEYVQ